MRGRRRVRFITGGESLFFNMPRTGRSLGGGSGRPARTADGQGPAGFRCRLATRAERGEWPVMKEEQSYWVVECARCADWAYGRKKRDVKAWGERHVSSAHRARRLHAHRAAGAGGMGRKVASPGWRRRPKGPE